MDERTIAMNNEASRTSSERLLAQLRQEGLSCRLWVSGGAAGSTVHVRVEGLDGAMRARILRVLGARGLTLDVAPA